MGRKDAYVRDDIELIYVGDPMCSWCWGIAPELELVTERFPDVALRIVVGGLRFGASAEPMTDEMAGFLGHHWDQVAEISGQPFDRSVLERRDWTYDTELACRAVVAMRMSEADKTFAMFKRIQRGFYAEARDVTSKDVYEGFAEDVGAGTEAFLAQFSDDASREATWNDFAISREWGVTGFPTLILRRGDEGHILARGYAEADDIGLALESLLS